MSPWRRRPRVALSIGEAAWQLSLPGESLGQGSITSLEDLVQGLSTLIPGRPGAGASIGVTVDERWARTFTVEPPAGLRSLAELEALAQARAAHLFGDDGSAWRIDAGWRVEGSFVATALPLPLIDAVGALARRLRWTLHRLEPRWTHAIEGQPGSGAARWVAVVQPAFLTVALRDRTGLRYARSLRTPPASDAAALRRTAERVAASAGVETAADPASCDWLDLRRPSTDAALSRLVTGGAHDAACGRGVFARPRPGHAWPSLVLAAATVGLLVHGGHRLHALDAEHDALERQVRALPPAAAPRVDAPRPPAPWSPREVEGLNAIAHRLNTPWPDIFAALERAAARDVALLGIEREGRQTRLRGSAQAKDHRAMVDYVDGLASQRPFDQARLVRHELDPRDSARPLRFHFEVALTARGGDAEAPR